VLGHPQRPQQIGLEDLPNDIDADIHRVGFDVFGVAVNAFQQNAGIVDQHINRAIGLLDPGRTRIGAVVARDVKNVTHHIAPIRAQRVRGRLDLRSIAPGEHHVEAMIAGELATDFKS